MPSLVIYHAPCFDGFTAAWVAWTYFCDKGATDVGYYPTEYYQEPPWNLITKDTEVYIVDFSYSRENTLKIKELSKSLQILDHHVSHQEALSDLPFATFDMERSGASMAWDYFWPNKEKPWLVRYVEDHDIWRNALPDTKEFHAYIGTFPFNFESWDAAYLTLKSEAGRADARKCGRAVLNSINQYVELMLPNAIEIELEGHKVPCINAPRPYISELLNRLCKDKPFSIGWFMKGNGRISYSLRSDNNGVNVKKIAELYSGGGHEHAAGFESVDLLGHIRISARKTHRT